MLTSGANALPGAFANFVNTATVGVARSSLGLGTGDNPTFNGLTLSDMMSAGTQCVQVNSAGVISGTGAACGIGGGGATLGSNTFTGTQTINPAANTDGLDISSFSLTGSSASPFVSLTGTWNTSGSPAAIFANITNTASGAAAKLLDLQVGGVSKFSVGVGGTVAGSRSFTGSISSPTDSYLATALNSYIITSDNADTSGSPAGKRGIAALAVEHTVGGTAFNAQGIGTFSIVQMTATPATAWDGDLVGSWSWAYSNVSVASGKGALTGSNPQVTLGSSATGPYRALQGTEIDVSNAGAVNTVVGLNITKLSSDTAQGSVLDSAVIVGAQAGTSLWGNGIVFSNYNGTFPLSSSACLVCVNTAGSVAKGIDISNLTLSGNAWTSTGSSIDQNGRVTGFTVLANGTSLPTIPAGSVFLAGTLSGNPTLANSPSGGLYLTGGGGNHLDGNGSLFDVSLVDHSGNTIAAVQHTGQGFMLGTNSPLQWNNGSNVADTGFSRTAAGAAALGNGTQGDATGALSLASINKVAITAPATSAILTIGNGKTLTASNTLTFTGTDGSSVAFGTGGTIAAVGYSGSATDLGTGTLAAARGGAGTINGLLKANGSGAVSQAVLGTDYAAAAATLTLGSTTLTLGGTVTTVSGLTLSGTTTFSGTNAVIGTTLPTQAAGTLGLGGLTSTPTLGASGEGDIYLTTNGGLNFIGQGVNNDVAVRNKGGTSVMIVPTGTQLGVFPGALAAHITGAIPSSEGNNSIYAEASSTTGQVGILAIGASGYSSLPNDKVMIMGYDFTNNVGWINPVEQQVAWRSLALVPNGGNVGIAMSTPSQLLTLASGGSVAWDNGTGTADTGLSRNAAGVIYAGNGAPGNASGTFNAASYQAGGTAGLATKTCTVNTTNVTTGITITIKGGLITGTTTC